MLRTQKFLKTQDESPHEKTNNLHMQKQGPEQLQVNCKVDHLAFVFAKQIVQFPYLLTTKLHTTMYHL